MLKVFGCRCCFVSVSTLERLLVVKLMSTPGFEVLGALASTINNIPFLVRLLPLRLLHCRKKIDPPETVSVDFHQHKWENSWNYEHRIRFFEFRHTRLSCLGYVESVYLVLAERVCDFDVPSRRLHHFLKIFVHFTTMCTLAIMLHQQTRQSSLHNWKNLRLYRSYFHRNAICVD